MKNIVKTAVIGPGGFVKALHLPNLEKLKDMFSVHAIADINADNAKEVAEKYGAKYHTTDYKQVLADPEVNAVIIGTRHDLHAQMTIKAAEAGKAVLVEKPMAINKKELSDVIDVLKKTGITYLVGHNRRYAKLIEMAKQILENRKNPAVITYRVNAGFFSLDHWTQVASIGGGRIIGEGCHMFDVLNYLTGSTVKSYHVEAITPALDIYTNTDNFTATMKYEDGSVGTLTYTSLGNSKFGKEYIEIFVDGKVIVVDNYQKITIKDEFCTDMQFDKVLKGHYEELVDFGKAIRKQRPLSVSLDEMVRATEISMEIDAYLRSLK